MNEVWEDYVVLHFDYDGIRVDFDDKATTIHRKTEDGLIIIARNEKDERRIVDHLIKLGFYPAVVPGLPRGGLQLDVGDIEDWMIFIQEDLPNSNAWVG